MIFPYFKVSVEPLDPSNLPKMIDALAKINKSFPSSSIKVEDNGDYVISGTGELYMDCILHHIRTVYSNIEIKVTDPVVSFAETIIETSAIKCIAESTNQKNKISIIAEPLDEGLENDILQFDLLDSNNKALLVDILEKDYNWELLTINNLWSINNSDNNINALINYTLPFKTNQNNLLSVKTYIEKGFNWFCSEGPLCEEPIRNVKFKIIDAEISNQGVYCSGGQIIPMMRRACSSSILVAAPRLMEPILICEVICPVDCLLLILIVLHFHIYFLYYCFVSQ